MDKHKSDLGVKVIPLGCEEGNLSYSTFIPNPCEIPQSVWFQVICFMYVWQVKKLLLLMSLFVLTVTTKSEGDSDHHPSPMLGVGTSSSSLLEVHTYLWEEPLVSLTPLRIAEPDPHLPARLGDTTVDFIINFLLYTSKYLGVFFTVTSRHRADLTKVPAQPALAPEAVQATGNQGVGWGVQIFPWSAFYFPPIIVWLLKWSSPRVP